jgi:hypothetical protein
MAVDLFQLIYALRAFSGEEIAMGREQAGRLGWVLLLQLSELRPHSLALRFRLLRQCSNVGFRLLDTAIAIEDVGVRLSKPINELVERVSLQTYGMKLRVESGHVLAQPSDFCVALALDALDAKDFLLKGLDAFLAS